MSPDRRGRLPGMEPVVVRVRGPLGATEARLRALLRQGRPVVVRLDGPVELDVLDRLARLRLLAGRLGVALEVRADDGGLLALTGLGPVLSGGRCGDPLGQPEAGEERGVEEVVDVHQLPG